MKRHHLVDRWQFLGGPAIRRHRLTTEDGTELAWYSAGREGAPAIAICNGLGGGIRVWAPLIERLESCYHVVSWDYRGLYGSAPSKTPGAYGVAQHARDLAALLSHARIERPVVMGWSMGVQVALELHRLRPGLARGLVAVHGTAARPVKSAFDSSTLWSIAPGLFGAMRALGSRLEPAASTLARSPVVAGTMVGVAKRLGLMSPGIDYPAFQDVAEAWLKLDLAVYAEIFQELDAHDAFDLLPHIETPALVIAGGRDRMTPVHLARDLAEELPNARLEIVDHATHFGLLEAPDEIALHALRFLAGLDAPSTLSQPFAL